MVVLSFVKYGNIHNAINFTFSIPCDAYLHIFYGLLHTFSSGPLRFCQQKHFSSFYLKDLTWSDNNMYLGPVVAAQKALDLSPQTSYPRKEKGGGGGGGGGGKSSGV